MTIAAHIIFWVLTFLFYVYYFGYNSSDIAYVWGFVGFFMPVTILSTYYVNYYLIPRFLLTKRYLKFTLYAVYTFIITSFFVTISIFLAFIFLANYYVDQMAPLTRSYMFIFIGIFIVIFLATAIRQLQHAYQVQAKNNELQNLMLEADLKLKTQELQYLKSQVHPHFLFNMLNTLYGMALKKDDQSPDTILRLSNLLDYVLYRINQSHVTLGKELEHLYDYIELEKLRIGSLLHLEADTSGADNDFIMAPLLLIPFVENCFKHGGYKEGKLHVCLNVESKADGLHFMIKNSVSAQVEQKGGGIGILNIKRRLELLYADHYDLAIKESDQWFEVNLHLGKMQMKTNTETEKKEL